MPAGTGPSRRVTQSNSLTNPTASVLYARTPVTPYHPVLQYLSSWIFGAISLATLALRLRDPGFLNSSGHGDTARTKPRRPPVHRSIVEWLALAHTHDISGINKLLIEYDYCLCSSYVGSFIVVREVVFTVSLVALVLAWTVLVSVLSKSMGIGSTNMSTRKSRRGRAPGGEQTATTLHSRSLGYVRDDELVGAAWGEWASFEESVRTRGRRKGQFAEMTEQVLEMW